MNIARKVVKDADTGVAITNTPEGLGAIHQPGCAAAIWRRAPSQAFQKWIDALDPDDLPQARVTLRPDMVRGAMAGLCAAAGVSGGPNCEHLVDDVAALADIFAAQMKAPYLQMRLEAVSTNACKKFHIDMLSARLICTYRGAGTQYGVSDHGEAPTRVFSVPTGAPILLIGTEWPDQDKPGLLHRSPPIEGTGETRLVLVLDPVYDAVPNDAVLR